MREGSLDAPIRHPVDWQNEAFYDADALDAEMRRIFDICHGCRRCFNLCDSFPRLFDLIDESEAASWTPSTAPTSAGGRRLHVVRHVLLDQMPVCRPMSSISTSSFDATARRGARQQTGFATKQLTETDRNALGR